MSYKLNSLLTQCRVKYWPGQSPKSPATELKSVSSRAAYPSEEALIEALRTDKIVRPHAASQVVFEQAQTMLNAALIPPQAAKSAVKPDKRQAQLQRLSQRILAFYERPQDASQLGERTYKQRFGHIEATQDGFQRVDDTTFSSVALKDLDAPHYNANQAAITANGQLLCVRSARTTTPEMLEENLLFGASYAQTPEYSALLVSALDISPLKSFFMRFLKAIGLRGEDERAFLRAEKAAISSLFQDAPTLTRQIGKQTVLLHKPLHLLLPLSTQAKQPRNLQRSRRSNQVAAAQLLTQMATKWLENDPQQPLFQQIAQCSDLAAKQKFLQKLQASDCARLSTNQQLCLQWFKMTFTDRDLHGTRQLDALAVEREIHGISAVGRELAQVLHLKCKSGIDRTQTMSNIVLLADTLYHQAGGTPYNPWEPSTPQDAATLSQHFKQISDDFSTNVVKLNRGAHGKLKNAKHPLNQHYQKKLPRA